MAAVENPGGIERRSKQIGEEVDAGIDSLQKPFEKYQYMSKVKDLKQYLLPRPRMTGAIFVLTSI